jgi:hypothetical protein
MVTVTTGRRGVTVAGKCRVRLSAQNHWHISDHPSLHSLLAQSLEGSACCPNLNHDHWQCHGPAVEACELVNGQRIGGKSGQVMVTLRVTATLPLPRLAVTTESSSHHRARRRSEPVPRPGRRRRARRRSGQNSMQFSVLLTALVFAAPCTAFLVGSPGMRHSLLAVSKPGVCGRFSASVLRNKPLRSQIRAAASSHGTPDTDISNAVLEAVAKAAKTAVEESTGEGTESGGPGIMLFIAPFAPLCNDCTTRAQDGMNGAHGSMTTSVTTCCLLSIACAFAGLRSCGQLFGRWSTARSRR